MHPGPSSIPVWLIVALAPLLMPSPLAAQAPPSAPAATTTRPSEESGSSRARAPGSQPLELEAERLEGELDENQAEAARLRALQEAATGDDADVLRRQLEELAVENMKLLGRMVDNLLLREGEGLDARGDRERLAKRMLPVGPRIVRVVRGADHDVSDLRRRRDAATGSERAALANRLEIRLDWLDTALAALVDHVERLDALGLDASQSRRILEEELPQRAALLAGRVRLERDRLDGLHERRDSGSADEDLPAEIAESRRRVDRAVESLRATAGLMRRLGLDATDHQKLLIETTGELSVELLDRDVVLGLARDWWERTREWVGRVAPETGFRLVRFALVLALAWAFAALAGRLARRAATSSRVRTSQLLQAMVTRLVGRVVLLLGLLLALAQLGVELAPLLAGLGIAGFIVGFALQDSLSNFAAGAMILFYRPFDVGDVVDAGGVFGRVDAMSLVSTTLLTFDNQTLVVPNSKIWGDVIRNVTSQKVRRVDLVVRVDYEEDLERVERLLAELIAEDRRILDTPAPVVKVDELAEWCVNLVVRPWVRTEDYWDVYWDLTRAVKLRFDREGVRMPVPQRGVRLRGAAAEPAADARTTTDGSA